MSLREAWSHFDLNRIDRLSIWVSVLVNCRCEVQKIVVVV
jgi:hypothetical protein